MRIDTISLCVATPLNKYHEPDLSFVLNTTDAIVRTCARDIISLEGTTRPGTADEELLLRVENGGLKFGDTLFLFYLPEREDPGNQKLTTRSIPKVVGGHTPACLEVGTVINGGVIDRVVPVSSTKVAEITTLLENINRAANIGFVNEMKIAADWRGIDIHEVIDAAATKPFGFCLIARAPASAVTA